MCPIAKYSVQSSCAATSPEQSFFCSVSKQEAPALSGTVLECGQATPPPQSRSQAAECAGLRERRVSVWVIDVKQGDGPEQKKQEVLAKTKQANENMAKALMRSIGSA